MKPLAASSFTEVRIFRNHFNQNTEAVPERQLQFSECTISALAKKGVTCVMPFRGRYKSGFYNATFEGKNVTLHVGSGTLHTCQAGGAGAPRRGGDSSIL